MSDCIRIALSESKFPKFLGEACPQTLYVGLWANAHNIHPSKSETRPLRNPPLRKATVQA